MNRVFKSWIVSLVLILTACTSLGLATPETFNQRLAYAYGTATSVRLVAADLLKAGTITVDNAKDVQSKVDAARTSLDAAKVASGAGDLSTAESKLSTAKAVLEAMQAYLNSKGGGS